MRGPLASRFGALIAVAVALVLSHDIVFLVRYGSTYGEALAHAGHDATWTASVVGALLLGGGLLVAALLRLYRLSIGARSTDRASRRVPRRVPRRASIREHAAVGRFARAWLLGTGRIALVTIVVLTIQENVERGRIGLSMPGASLLVSAEYPWAIAIAAAVSAAVALVVALFRWRRDILVARIRSIRPAVRPSAAPRVVGRRIRPPVSLLGSRRGLRAPPILAAS